MAGKFKRKGKEMLIKLISTSPGDVKAWQKVERNVNFYDENLLLIDGCDKLTRQKHDHMLVEIEAI